MLTSPHLEGCALCLGRIVDAGDELVCSSCGMVSSKEVVEGVEDRTPQAMDYTSHSQGSYMGPLEYGCEEIFSKGLSGSPSTYKYMKTISDFSCRDGSGVYSCAKLMERVCEKLVLPKSVVGESVAIAKCVIEMRKEHGEITIAAISAFSIINACKRLRVTRVGVREIMEAHTNLGYRVKASVIIRISIDSSVKTGPRMAEEYLGNVLVHLQQSLAGEDGVTAGYFNKLYEAARTRAREHRRAIQGRPQPPSARRDCGLYWRDGALELGGAEEDHLTEGDCGLRRGGGVHGEGAVRGDIQAEDGGDPEVSEIEREPSPTTVS